MTGPVTLVVARRVLPGREADYERQLRILQQQVHGTEGYLGTEVVHNSAEHEYVSIVRFDSLANLRAWQASGQRERWQVDLDGIVAGDATVRHAEAAPRFIRVTIGAVLQVLLLNYVIMPRVTRLLAFWLFPSPQRRGGPFPSPPSTSIGDRFIR